MVVRFNRMTYGRHIETLPSSQIVPSWIVHNHLTFKTKIHQLILGVVVGDGSTKPLQRYAYSNTVLLD